MRRTLALHPASRCAAVSRIDVDITRVQPNGLILRYVATGHIGDVQLPPMTSSSRTDELWRHTCFEAFIRLATGVHYYELNFSPSTQWAAYGFSGYRNGMRALTEIEAPRIDVNTGDDRYILQASADLSRLAELPGDAAWRLGLSAVIEEKDGSLSYWALAHPKGRADFHHSDCFALELPRA